MRFAGTSGPRKAPRRGAVAVELALLLPVLVSLLVIATDFARLYYTHVTITTCARNGALWASDPPTQSQSFYTSPQAAAVPDGTSLSPALTTGDVDVKYATSASGPYSSSSPTGMNYVQVTVTRSFQPIAPLAFLRLLGTSTPITLSRSVWMRIAPAVPS
jgi:Flp pilus assembly protein TadG